MFGSSTALWDTPRDHKLVGECLEAVRKSVGMTQQELAKRLRKPQSFVSSYESGQRRIDLFELSRIVTALDGDVHVVAARILSRIAGPRRRSRKSA